MRERDRIELRRFREEEERKSREAIEREAAQLSRTHAQLHEMNRKTFLQTKDEELYVSPELIGARMELSSAVAHNKAEVAKFIASTPDYYPCSSNSELMMQYMTVNNCEIINAPMWKCCYEKALALGLLKTGPDPEPVQLVQQEQEQEPELEFIPASTPRPVAHKVLPQGSMYGRDLQSGEIRVFTDFELEKLSASDYRRVLQLPSIENMQFPVR